MKECENRSIIVEDMTKVKCHVFYGPLCSIVAGLATERWLQIVVVGDDIVGGVVEEMSYTTLQFDDIP